MADLLPNQTDSEAHGSDSDLAWETFLPPHYEDILEQAPDAPLNTSSKKEIHDYLYNRVLIQNGTQVCWLIAPLDRLKLSSLKVVFQEFWLDPVSQGVCQSIGARTSSIAWGVDTRYWSWRTQEGARYPECACLELVCWFDIRAELLCYLWRVLMGEQMFGWDEGPVQFSFETSDGQRVDIEYSLSANGRQDRFSMTTGWDSIGSRMIGWKLQ